MIDYCVLDCEALDGLVIDVRNKIAEGWMPIGGVAVAHIPRTKNNTLGLSSLYFYQAMIREPDTSTLKRKLINARKKGWSLESVVAKYLDEEISAQDQR